MASRAAYVLLLLVASASVTSLKKTSTVKLRQYGDRNVVENNGITCTFPCTVRAEDGQPLIIPPNVIWQRKGDSDDIFRALQDPYWLRKDIDINFALTRIPTGCISRIDNQNTTYYDCDFHQVPCFIRKHAGEYRCIVLPQHAKEGSIALKSLLNDIPLGTKDGVAPLCFLPRPIDFSVEYNASSTLTLTWSLSEPSDNNTVCPGGSSFQIRARWYNSYDDFLYLPMQSFAGVIDFSGNSTTQYELDVSQIATATYFVFDLMNFRRRTESIEHQITTSPVFYFERQESPTVVFPVASPYLITAPSGSVVNIRCEGRGLPPPTVTMYSAGLGITSTSGNQSVFLKSLVLNEETEGVYQCVVANTIISPADWRAEPIAKLQFIRLVALPSSNDGLDGDLTCSAHGNSVCTEYFSNRKVLVNSSDATFENQIQSMVFSLHTLTTSSQDPTLSRCVDLASATLCHSAFPFCSSTEPLITRPVCQRTCDLFRAGGACEGVVTPERFPGVFKMMMSQCDDVEFPGGSDTECIQLQFEQLSEVGTSWCNIDDGQSYSGYKSTTESQRLCQEWGTQSPHRHSRFEVGRLHRATNNCRNPNGLGERPWCYTADPGVRWEYCDVPQCRICEAYKDHFCSSLPGYSSGASIYINRHESEWDELGAEFAESWMVNNYLNLTRDADLPRGCEEGLREFLCHSTLPLCSGSATPSQMCSEHCELMQLLEVCPNRVLEQIRQRIGHSNRTFAQPDCAVQTSSNPACMPVHTTLRVTPGAIVISNGDAEDCYNVSTNGADYMGTISKTVSGAECKAWGSYWTGMEDANYCRNPRDVGARPWCFTNKERTHWEYCNITECESEPPISVTDVVTRGVSSSTIGIITTFALVGVLFIVGSIVLAIIIAVMWKHKQKQNEAKELSLLKLNRTGKNWDYVVNQTYVQVGGLPPKIKEAIDSFRQYDKSSIKYIRQLGSGNFGVVFYGRLEGVVVDDQKSVEVAVKTLKEEHSTEGLDDFVREAKLMFSFNHPNIVKILGVCVDDMPYYLIFEYMDKGDLAQFLRASASSLQRREMNPLDGRPRSRTESTLSDEPPALNVEQLADICRQIACGMEYLSNNNHVHRDLACRNCLVKSCDNWEQTPSGYIIKIGDFGMSQNLYTSDYYRVRGQAVLPIRWMSPEAVIYGKFSTDSDVWSFGVVMWEVFSFAMQPYYGISNEGVTEAIRRHRLLAKPANCPTSMYDIMKSCWMLQPKMRPGFDELVKILSDCRLSVSSGDSDEYCDDSELDSDAFYEENSDVEAAETVTMVTTTTTITTGAISTTTNDADQVTTTTINNDGTETTKV